MTSLVAVLCSLSLCAYPQQVRTMRLAELFDLAEAGSRRIQVYTTAGEAADEAVRAARAARLPEISISLSASYLGDGWLSDRDYQHSINIDMPHFGNNFAAEVTQVLYAGGAISSGIALAELGQKMAALDLRKNRQEVRFLIVGHYLDLYKLDNQAQVLEQNIDLTQSVLRQMEARRAQGTVLQNDITRYELQLATFRLRLEQVRSARSVLNHQLVTTLQLPAATEIRPDTTVVADGMSPQAEADWQRLAVDGNIGLSQAALAKDISRQELRQTCAASKPSVALIAEDHLDGPITVEVPVLDNNFNYWFIGLGVKYELSSLYKNNAGIRRARLNVRRAEEAHALIAEQVENAVQAQYAELLTAHTERHTQEKSVELARQNYDITARRYASELALLTDMVDAGNMKLASELALVNARINVVYNYYKLRYIAGNL